MKTLIMAAAALATLTAAPAFAQTASTVNLNGNVANACGVGNAIGGAGVAAGFNAGDITAIPLADANGQFDGESYSNRSFGNLWCNYAAPVKMEVSALKTNVAVGDTDSFTNSFDVRITTDAGVYFGQGEDYVLSSTNGASGVLTGTSAGAFETGSGRFGGADLVEILPSTRAAGGNRRAVAGAYAGTIKFTVGSN